MASFFTVSELAVLMALIAFVKPQASYVKRIASGNLRPHAVSWLLWSILTWINVVAQFDDGVGIAMAVTVNSAVFSAIVFAFSLFLGNRKLSRSDWTCLLLALSAIGIWMLTDVAEFAVVISSAVNLLAFIPTVRRAWNHPYQESVTPYVIGVSLWGLMLGTLGAFSIVAALWGLTAALLNCGLIAMVLTRRRAPTRAEVEVPAVAYQRVAA